MEGLFSSRLGMGEVGQKVESGGFSFAHPSTQTTELANSRQVWAVSLGEWTLQSRVSVPHALQHPLNILSTKPTISKLLPVLDPLPIK